MIRSTTHGCLLSVLLSAFGGCSPRAVIGAGGQNGGPSGPGNSDGGGGGGDSGGMMVSLGGRAGSGVMQGAGAATQTTGGAGGTTGSGGATDPEGARDAASADGIRGGLPDASPIDAATGMEAGAAVGCPGLFCEDFEKGSLDPAIWDVKVNSGQPTPAVVTQSGMVAHGKYAAHFHANPNAVSYDFIITKNPPAGLQGHHFGRAYFMITPMPPTNHTEYIYAGTTGFPEYQYLEVASAAPLVWQLTYVDLVQPTTGEDYHSGGKVPIGNWFCLEWEFNDTPDQAAVYVDGVQAFAQNTFTFGGATTGLVGGFAAFGFGYYIWHPVTYAFDVYYDDIVLDTKRVGCLN